MAISAISRRALCAPRRIRAAGDHPMQAATIAAFGDIDVLDFGEVPTPSPKAHHVLIKIDSADVVPETDETNNVFASPLADVIIPAPVVPPAPLPVKIGSPDPNFGTEGLAVHDVGITTTSDVAVQDDGKSVIVGTSGTSAPFARAFCAAPAVRSVKSS